MATVKEKKQTKGKWISEEEIMKLNYPEAPLVVTDTIPGPKGQAIWDEAFKFETPTRVGGMGLPFVWQEALGAGVKDPDGNIMVDLTGGLGTNNTGHTHPRVVQAIIEQAPKLMHTLDMVNIPRTQLAKRLSEIMPGELKDNSFTCFATSGSAAIDIAVKYARYITGRPEILAFQGAYHGVYGNSLALTSSYHYRQGFGPFPGGAHHMPYGYCYRCFANLEYPSCDTQCARYFDYVVNGPYTGVYEPAAVVVEPYQGEGGYVAPPAEFYQIIREACDKAGMLMIVDEIQAGFGRTGKMWAIEQYAGVTPDIVVWGKGIGGDQPLTGVTVNNKYKDKLDPGSQPATFPGNALSCAVALTNIDIMTDPKDNLIGRTEAIGAEMKAKLQAAADRSPVIGEVRGSGFYLSVELVRDKETRAPVDPMQVYGIMYAMRDQGYLVFPCGRNGNVMRLMPVLTTPKAFFDRAVDDLLDTIDRATDGLINTEPAGH
jgi:4-aminobutyrate aminotransferase